MTQVLSQGETSLRAILPRILIALGLVLFGASQSHALAAVAQAGPSAHSQIDQSDGILTPQRYLLRGHLADDTPQDMVEQVAAIAVRQPVLAKLMRMAPQPAFAPVVIRILPPVRGPPAA